ncbi:CARDB domain-containing protein [Candidatus Uabimicrobium sp. HlEnr_7]|uniref:CARDB domain-containing protein n=1 Tax=Candidatus Uabimicrobium helgolandensis TaxID=3095367 RepID=UPI00355830DE
MEEEICRGTKKKRDLRLDGLKIAGKPAVRDIIILTPNDIAKKSIAGKSYFKLQYNLHNDGFMAVKDFDNLCYFNDKVVAQQKNLSAGANDTQIMKDTAVLDIKDGDLIVRADAFSRVQEDDESNNDIKVNIAFKGFRKGSSKEPHIHIEALRIAEKVPINGMMKLQKVDSIATKKGRYGFRVEYVIRNYGLREAVGIDNLFLLNGKRFFRHPNINLRPGESKLMKLPVYFPIKSGAVTLRADANNKYPKGEGCNLELGAKVFFMGFPRTR